MLNMRIIDNESMHHGDLRHCQTTAVHQYSCITHSIFGISPESVTEESHWHRGWGEHRKDPCLALAG